MSGSARATKHPFGPILLAGLLSAFSAGAWAVPLRQEPAAEFPSLPPPPEVTGLYGMPPRQPVGRDTFLDLLTREAERVGLPAALADAVASVESGYDASVTGAAGEIGIMQILPSTAFMLGHRGPVSDLFDPEANIRLGVRYLARAWVLADGDLCRTLMKYRAGHGEERMTPLSVRYCARARAHLEATGSPLARLEVPPEVRAAIVLAAATEAAPEGLSAGASPSKGGRSRVRRARLRTPEVSRRFWAAHEARIRAINAKLEARWVRVMAGS
jgi:hypothetical protein